MRNLTRTAPSATDTALALVDRLYSAAMEPRQWTSALRDLGRFAGGIAADLFIRTADSDDFVAWSGIPDELMDEYLAHYHADNRRVLTAATLPAGTLLTDFDLYTPDEIAREPYYQELLFAHGYGYFTGTSLIAREATRAFYGVHYALGADAYDSRNLQRLHLLAPHMQRAAELQARLGAAISREQQLQEAFEALSIGALLLDHHGQVAHANAAALALATPSHGLALEGRELRALLSDHDRALRGLLRSALGNDDKLAARGGQMLVRGPAGAVCTLLLAPLSTFRRRADSLAAIVLLGDGRFRRTRLAHDALCEGYGLTRAEAALALGLAEGMTIAEYARTAGLTVGSARTVSKRVMAKLGVNRQAELASLLVMQFGFLAEPRQPGAARNTP